MTIRRPIHWFLAVAVLAAAAAPVVAETPWWKHYERGLELIQDGDGEAAVEALDAALGLAPDPELRAPTEGPRFVDYLPHLYLAVAHHMAGDPASARDQLARSRAAGAAAKSDAGRSLLEAYEVLLGEGEATENPTYREFEPKPVVLSDEEFLATQREVAMRCGLEPATDYSDAPWYFHYELGLALAEKDDPQRALYALLDAAEKRADSKRSARMYGMWFIDYLPYYEIAKLHAGLGNWQCAADALRFSEREGEVTEHDDEFDEFWTLREEVAAREGQE